MIKLKKICLLIPVILLFSAAPFKLRAVEDTTIMPGIVTAPTSNTRKKISDLSVIVNDTKKNDGQKKFEIEKAIKDLIDYHQFFSTVLPAESEWEKFTEKEKQLVIAKYNKQYINNYFNLITNCNPLSISLNDNEEKKDTITEIRGSYKCSRENKSIGLSVLNTSGKIINIEINGLSFIKSQQDEFKAILNREKSDGMKAFLLKEDK